jgi:ABC-type sugar transport system substrate-binding protein
MSNIRIVPTSAALYTFLAIGGLGASAQAASLPESCKAAKPVIGVTLPSTTNPYYIAMRDSFLKHGAELGYDIKSSQRRRHSRLHGECYCFGRRPEGAKRLVC